MHFLCFCVGGGGSGGDNGCGGSDINVDSGCGFSRGGSINCCCCDLYRS